MSAPPRDSRGRLGLFVLLGAASFLILTVRLFWVQILEGDSWSSRARDQHVERVTLPPHRGTIVDRYGIRLAYTAENPTLCVESTALDRSRIPELARTLAPLLQVPPADLLRRLTRGRGTIRLNPKATDLTTEQLVNLPDPVRVEREPKRIYPLGSAAAHLTGFVGVDQEGIDGLELTWDDALKGESGWTTYLRDAGGHRHADGVERPPVAGDSLVLTIDAELQQMVAYELGEAVRTCDAKGGYAIVIDPKSGDILAMANCPAYDPTWYDRADNRDHHRNFIVCDAIEPGSTIKALTAAAALEDGAFRPTTLIDCHNGQWMLQGKPITDHERFGVIPFIDTFVHSSNIGMAQVGLRLGPEKMYHYFRRFGLAEKTGIGLSGESPGLLRRPETWSARTPATVAFGYELRVSPLQMAMAYAAIANNGVLMKPRLVKAVAHAGQPLHEVPIQEVRRAITEKTARTLLDFMQKTVEGGTGKKAAVDWCVVGGKTGTARKYDNASGGYVSRHYASFVGVAPVNNPRLLCYSIIDEPKGEIYGGSTAAPLFREILESARGLAHPLIRPDYDVLSPEARPDNGGAKHEMLPVAGRLEAPKLESSDRADADTTRAQQGLREFAQARSESAAAVMPDSLVSLGAAPRLLGMTLRQALDAARRAGFHVSAANEPGVVVRQYPAPGEAVPRLTGGSITLYFGDRNELAAKVDHEKR